MSPQDDDLSLIFGLSRESPFFFKCQRCCVCCSNRTIRLGSYEILRLSRNLGITIGAFLQTFCEDKSTILRNKPDGGCIFLAPQGCGVHPDRPLVCRLYPLGVLWGAEGEERFANMPPHPDCLGYLSDEGTVADYLASQDVEQFLGCEKMA
jgi:Fe-S-cluster containining protein